MTTPTRREFLRATSAATVAGVVGTSGSARASRDALPATADSVIFLLMTGGPSQLDTFDPKPDAPSEIRSPFSPIRTRFPGVLLSELFPKMAGIADKFSLIRSVHHDAPPVHEAGIQLLNTGRYFRTGPAWPSLASVLALQSGSRLSATPIQHRIAPHADIDTGIHVDLGFGPGFLNGRVAAPIMGFNTRSQNESVTSFEKNSDFAQNCQAAFRSLERGTNQFIQINQFTTVFDSASWDCHADGGSLACDLGDYKDTVAPTFDAAFSSLILNLESRGLLDRTLVLATGEFGRTPRFNSQGGRDHWAGCWTTILAGGGVKGGRVIGASDSIASEPADRPVALRDIPATIFRALGVGSNATIAGPDGQPTRICEGLPVHELFS